MSMKRRVIYDTPLDCAESKTETIEKGAARIHKIANKRVVGSYTSTKRETRRGRRMIEGGES